jgi:hypothetical protein
MNDAGNIVGEQLGQRLMFHGRIGSTPDVIPNFSFNRRENRFHIAALVVMVHILSPVELVIVEHFFKQSANSPGRIAFEGDERCCPLSKDRFDILDRKIAFVSGPFFGRKVLSGAGLERFAPKLIFFYQIHFISLCFVSFV